MNPPQEGEPSYQQFVEEKNKILSSLAQRAKMVAETFNSVPGMSCNIVQGAMYAFPQVMPFLEWIRKECSERFYNCFDSSKWL